MSVPPDLMQQLLQGGLLNVQGAPNVQGGLLGAGDQATAQYGGLTNIGMQLLANSGSGGRFGSILGKSMLDSQQLAQQTAMKKIEMAQQLMGLGMTQQKMSALAPFLGGAPGGAAGPQAAPGGIPQAASAAVPQMPAQPQGGLLGTTQQPQQVAAASDDFSQTPIAGMAPDMYRRLQILSGKDPLETEKEIRALQLQSVQQQVKPQVDSLDTIIKSDKPMQYVQSHPALMNQLQQGAAILGIDLSKGANDQVVRTALTAQRNALASRAQLGIEAPPVPLQTRNGALGSIYQTDPVTGKISQVKGEEDLKQVVDSKTGLPTLVPASQAAGKQPFNASIYGAQNVSDQALQFAADTYRTTGKFPAAFGRNPAMQAKVLEKVASDAAANGDTAGSIAARQGALKANGQAMDMNTKKLAFIEPATKKLDLDITNLLAAADKAGGVQSPLVNRAIRAWQQGVQGSGDVAQLVIHMNAVEGEYAKLNSGGTGAAAPSVTVRKEAHDAINKYMSKGTLADVGQAIRMDGQNALKVLQDERDSLSTAMGQNAPGAGKSLDHPGQTTTIGGFTVTRVN